MYISKIEKFILYLYIHKEKIENVHNRAMNLSTHSNKKTEYSFMINKYNNIIYCFKMYN